MRKTIDTVYQNQQSLQQSLTEAERHILVLRRILADALSGTTRVRSIQLPPNIENERKPQVIDWDWYHTQLGVSDSHSEFMDGLRIYDEAEVALRLKKRHLQGVVRETSAKLKEIERAAKKSGDDKAEVSAEVAQFMDKARQVAQTAKEAIQALNDGQHERADELMEQLRLFAEEEERKQAEAQQKKQAEAQQQAAAPAAPTETPPAETPQEFPDGAVIFGGDL